MKIKDLIASLQEQDPESEVIIVAESYSEEAGYYYTATEVRGEDTVVYVETDYVDEEI